MDKFVPIIYSERSESLQAFRFVAAALVLVTHVTLYYHERINSAVLMWKGGIGVLFFFVISGIVMVMSSVTLTLDATGAREFMARRLLRIVPLYWLITLFKVAVVVALPSVIQHNHFDLVRIIKSFLFIPAYNADGHIEPIHGVGWTLQHEMFFYALFAVMMLFGRSPARWASATILGLVALGAVVTQESAIMRVFTHPINLYFVVGMAIGSVIVHGGVRRTDAKVLFAGLLLAAILKWLLPDAVTAILPLAPLVLVLGALMLLLVSWRLPRPLRVMIALGDSSYALYLFHPLIAPLLVIMVHQVAAPLGVLAEVGLTVIVTIVLAHGVHKGIELPLGRLVKRIFRPSVHIQPLVEEPALGK
jgi:peptidoglycan/LPS O-acetylase OafA/YrhL